MKKTILLFVMAAILLVSLCPISTLAQSNAPAFVLTDGEGGVGDTVTIALKTENNTGIISLKVMVGYDDDVLELIGVSGGEFDGVSFGPTSANPIAVNWVNALMQSEVDGAVAYLTFRILNASAEKSEITLSYDEDDIFDEAYENVFFETVNGTIGIKTALRGDFNEDGDVNSSDALYLLRATLMPDAFPISQKGDVNGDSIMDSGDAMYLLRHTLSPSAFPLCK